MSDPTSHPPASPPARRSGRIAGFSIASGIAAVIALGLLAAAGALLYVDVKKDDDGYYTTSSKRVHTGSYAIASGKLDLDLDGADKLIDDAGIGHLRVHAESKGGEPSFVGIARSDDVARYLRGTAYTTVTDVDADPFGDSFKPIYRDSDGTRRPAPPAARDIWVASASGTGEQSLKWKVRDGDWSVVVMNADASRGVDTSVSAGATLPFTGPAGWTLLGLGALTAGAAAALLLLGLRGPRSDRPAPTHAAPAQAAV